LDAKWIRDEKDDNMKRKYRERARSYTRKVHEGGLILFVIDTSDLTERVEEEFFNLEDSLREFVMTVVVGKIFNSIGKTYPRVSVRDFVEWEIHGP
jgi:hypothetical protein